MDRECISGYIQWGPHVKDRLGEKLRARPSLKDCTAGVSHRLVRGSEFQSVIVREKKPYLYVSVGVLSCLYL